jgi:para-nitrobenzyl esterase
MEPEARTQTGAVRGRWEGEIAVFRGIPYAQAPIGALRFAPPVPARSWEGVREAADFSPPAPQPAYRVESAESCLTVNVWSPSPGATRLPVLAWVHGGAYRLGRSANPHFDGATLAATGAVVVSLNYRLGLEGFGRLAGAPDNRGILDQIRALGWVRDNIAAFGGDPGNVTVFGQSAGAGCIAAMLAMPSTAGLFRRAVVQSLPGTYFSPRLAAAVSDSIADELGVPMSELAGLPVGAVIDATESVIGTMPGRVEFWGPMALTPTPFSPVVDGEVLPGAPWQALADGAARNVDLLVGHTRDEFRALAARLGPVVTADVLTAALDRVPLGRDAYGAADPARLFESAYSDWLLRMPCLHLAGAQQAGGGTARLYELSWPRSEREGAGHSLDVLLLFGTLEVDGVRGDPAVGHAMRADWLRFAATGDPGWRSYDPDTRIARNYDTEVSTGTYPEEASRRIWRDHRFGTLDLLPPVSSG